MFLAKREELKTVVSVIEAYCLRCGEHKNLDNYQLCERCNEKIEEEYILMYTVGTMEH
jgi:hypothetical protein